MIDLKGTLRRIAASITSASGMGDDILEDTGTTIPAQLEHMDFGECVYYENGAPTGTAYPLGTPTNPVGSLADAKTIADALNIYCIHIHGAATIPAMMEHYSFFGERHEDIADIVNLNGQDVDGSVFKGLTLTGAQGGASFISIHDCILASVTVLHGFITNSAFYGSTFGFKNDRFIDIDSCYSIYGAVTMTVLAPDRASVKDWSGNLILTNQTGGTMLVRGFYGTLEIDNMSGGTLSVYANGADITINNDCDGGTINIYGNATITNNTGGTAVNIFTLEGRTKGQDDIHDDLGTHRTALTNHESLQSTHRTALTNHASAQSTHRTALTNHESAQSTHRAVLVDIHGTDLPAVKAVADAIAVLTDTKVMGRVQVVEEEIDIELAAGSYVLFIGTAQDVVIESLVFRSVRDCSADGAFTGISIETDNTTEQVFISQANGVQVNLTAESQISWTGAVLLKATETISLTIYGGATAAPSSCDVIVAYKALVSGGYLDPA